VHRAILASGDGINFRDSDGNALTAIGNVTYKAGDAVWTDGRCIYGWVRPNQPNELSFPAGGYDCPWFEVAGGYPTAAYVLPFTKPRDMKKLCDLGAWVRNAEGVFVAGEKASFVIFQDGHRKAVNVETGDEIALAIPARSSSQSDLVIYDAVVDDDGNLLVLEVYPDTSGDYLGFAVHLNDEIIDTVDGIEGGEHAETVYTSPMALHLFDDGSFVGTLRENTAEDNWLLVDELGEIERTEISVDTDGDVETRAAWYFEVITQSDDVTECVYKFSAPHPSYGPQDWYEVQPFKDFQAVHQSRTGAFSGSLYYFNSEDGKSEIYKQTDNRYYEQEYPYAKIDGEYFDDYDYTITSPTGPDRIMTISFRQVRRNEGGISRYCFKLEATVIETISPDWYGSIIFHAETYINYDFMTAADENHAYPAFPRGWAAITSDPAETGTPYDFELDDASISCEAPSNPNLDGLGELQRGALLPVGFTGGASVRGLSFQQAEMQVLDAVKVPGGYLLLTTGGLYFSHGGTAELIRGGFRAPLNTRIRESDDIDAVRDGLARNTLD